MKVCCPLISKLKCHCFLCWNMGFHIRRSGARKCMVV